MSIGNQDGKNFDSSLLSVNRAIEEREAIRKAKLLNLGYINIQKIGINPDVLKIIPEAQALEAKLFVFFKTGSKLRIGLVDPESNETKKYMEVLHTQGFELNLNICSSSSLQDALGQYKNIYKEQVQKIENIMTSADVPLAALSNLESKTSAELINELFFKALQFNASDIHVEPEEKRTIVRFRIDGILRQVTELPPTQYDELAKQIKFQSHLKLNITTRPQDGRTYFIVNNQQIDVRVSCLPSVYGEDIVMRLLGNTDQKLTVDDLGLEGYAYKAVKTILERPHGMVLVTGPTGSGKTTTLYAILSTLNDGTNKIITLEDPVEYRLVGITQSQIDEHENYDFVLGLKSILRQDPDVVMIGEIRDRETAEVAAQAALTGHKVLSTLHTNNAVGSLSRLHNMGVEGFVLAPALEIVIGQRLVRKICSDCNEVLPISEAMRKEFEKILPQITAVTGENYTIPDSLPQPKGCEKCHQTGYKGRIGIFEVLSVDENVKEFILGQVHDKEVSDYARSKGMIDLFQDGILKVIRGITTLEEVYRVTEES